MMPARKTETLTIRLCPELKAALRQTAARERRSLSNMLEIMIRDYPGLDPRLAPKAPEVFKGTSGLGVHPDA